MSWLDGIDSPSDTVDPTDPTAFANLPMALQAYNKMGGGTAQPFIQPQRAEQLPPEEAQAPNAKPAGVGAGGIGDFGQGRIQKQLEADANTQLVTPEQQKQIDAANAVREAHHYEGISEVQKTEAQLVGLQASQETLNRARLSGESVAQEKLTRTAMRAQYPGLSIPEIEQLQAVADDDTGKYNDQQKRAAQLSLKRASTVDPNRLLTSSTGNRILAIIAQALGAAGTGLSGGKIPNFGLQAVNEAIDRDIMAQKEAFEAGDRAYGRQKSLYADVKSHFDTESQAIAAQRSLLLSVVASQMDKYKLIDGADQLRQQAIQEQMKVKQEQVSLNINGLARAQQSARDQQLGALENKKYDIIAGKEDAKSKQKRLYPGGTEPIPGEEDQLPEMKVNSAPYKLMAGYNAAMPLIKDLEAARGKYGAEILNRYGVADMRGLHAMLRAKLISGLQLSRRISPAENAILNNLESADPTKPAPILEMLKQLRESMQDATNGELSIYHLRVPGAK